MKKLLLLILSVVALSQAYCSSKGTPAAASGGGNTVSIVVSAAGMGSMAFSPSPLTIAKGTTVVWTNNDSINHTVSSNTGVFDSGNMNAGQTFSFTFATAGTFPYHCNVHPSMTGSVVVQ